MRPLFALLLVASLAAPALADPPAGEPFRDAKKTFQEAKGLLLREYVDDGLDEARLYRGAVAGMLAASGRKWDALLSPSEMAEMRRQLSGQIVGIGIEIDVDVEHGFLTVIGVFPGSPAERAGIKVGDRIIKVDGKPIAADPEQVARSIRGKVGTPITLTLLRTDEIVTKTLERAPIVIAAVSDLELPGKVWVVWLRVFNQQTPALLQATLERIAARHPRGLVLDLRENEGGLFDKMIDCAGQLLPRGSVVVTELRRGHREERVRTVTDPLLREVPLAVLIDHGTASGGEILAGALRDDLGARLIGARTHGKWNVQRIEDLSNGYAMKFTVGVFQTPKGLSPDGRGIDPDVPVDLDDKTIERVLRIKDPAARVAADPQLRAALALIK